MSLYDILASLENVGAFDIALPFILIFTVSFAIMQKIQLFGAKKKNIDLIVSLVLALLAIRNIFLIEMLNRFLPNIAMFLIIILMFLLILGTFGGPLTGFKGFMAGVAVIISLLFVIMSLSSDLSYGFVFPNFLTDFFLDYQTKSIILFVFGLVAVIYFTSAGNETNWTDWVKERAEEVFGRGARR